MTYEKLIHMKYQLGYTTHELVKQFPKDMQRIHEVALLDIPEDLLEDIKLEEKIHQKIKALKKQYDHKNFKVESL